MTMNEDEEQQVDALIPAFCYLNLTAQVFIRLKYGVTRTPAIFADCFNWDNFVARYGSQALLQ